jgi:hypothetical protein
MMEALFASEASLYCASQSALGAQNPTHCHQFEMQYKIGELQAPATVWASDPVIGHKAQLLSCIAFRAVVHLLCCPKLGATESRDKRLPQYDVTSSNITPNHACQCKTYN